MSENWYGMRPSVLDETPNVTPASPSIGDYLSMFQTRNKEWRESIKPAYNQPYRVAVDEAVVDPILNQTASPAPAFSAWQDNGDRDATFGVDPQSPSIDLNDLTSPFSGAPGAVKTAFGSLNNARNLGLAGSALGLYGLPGMGLIGAGIGANMDTNLGNAMAARSFGVPDDISALSAFGNAISFGLLGNSVADQLSNLGYEASSQPDGTFGGIRDADEDPYGAYTAADMDVFDRAEREGRVGSDAGGHNTKGGRADRADKDGPSDNSNDDGGCFLTTAAVKYAGEKDDGATLTTLRWFRDNVMRKVPAWSQDVEEYYRIAPLIVERIGADETFYQGVLEKYIRPAVSAINAKRYARARRSYKRMVEEASKA
jgi:hypothetical protein